ncbi:type II toxin-antitoxin system VapC family toxin [Goodfellowiella coeruleoviolacea]|uniref:Nucleic acid-binding protein, contains PIN domain n=1 Tax=Goodfellowiella coeruleoviolacea TaxID=334858 RepID=A0AAE3GDD2_9PSEU|nr:type II toxin-antitoxin system VapC family toxin [Goodfellowiella coeruleoviolacea]MCP2165330.1 putative nucleic acid-binding protein, contains PIN domain [Goodfellowiella coeruleoviolacea]
MIYLDSSALVKLIHPEEHSTALNRHLAAASAPLVSSEYTRIEVSLALRRHGDGAARLKKTEHLLDKIARLPVAEVLRRAAQVAGPPRHGPGPLDAEAHPGAVPRVSDALHVATAVALGPALSEFITYDAALARVAADAGLPVVSPGLLAGAANGHGSTGLLRGQGGSTGQDSPLPV